MAACMCTGSTWGVLYFLSYTVTRRKVFKITFFSCELNYRNMCNNDGSSLCLFYSLSKYSITTLKLSPLPSAWHAWGGSNLNWGYVRVRTYLDVRLIYNKQKSTFVAWPNARVASSLRLLYLPARKSSIAESIGDIYLFPRDHLHTCLLYTSPSPRDRQKSRMPSSA